MDILHVALTKPNPQLFTPRFCRELEQIGSLKIVEQGCKLGPDAVASIVRECNVLITGWGSVSVPKALAKYPGRLGYICHLTGTVAGMVPMEIIRSGLLVTNWGSAPAFPVAEGALALLLACLKQLPEHAVTKRNGQWYPQHRSWIGSMNNLRLGLYGYGAIGRAFYKLCRPFNPKVTVLDPYVTELPDGVARASSLGELFDRTDVLAIHAALTGETEGSVTAELLARLPEGGIVINTARGEIIDQDALFVELAAGRLRAGLDVLNGNDRLPSGHVALDWPNLILSSHQIHLSNWPPDPDRLDPWHKVALENLRQFARGEPLGCSLSETQLARST